MLKYGRISAIDSAKGLVRVNFDDDEIVSNWIGVSMPKTKDDQYFIMPDINEHVWCIMDEFCENGVVGGCLYDAKNKPAAGADNISYIQFKDGTVVKYDRTAHKMTIIVGAVSYEISEAGHKIGSGSETLKKIISDLIDEIVAMTQVVASGTTVAPPVNAANFAAIKTRLLTLLT